MPASHLDLSKNGTQCIAFLTEQHTLAIVQNGHAFELDFQQAIALYDYMGELNVKDFSKPLTSPLHQSDKGNGL